MREFNHNNNLDLIVRSRCIKDDGFQKWFKEESLLDFCSLANYANTVMNLGVVVKIDKRSQVDIIRFAQMKDKKIHSHRLVEPPRVTEQKLN